MTVKSPPLFLQTSTVTAEDLRAYLTSQLGGRGGLVTAAALAVTQNGTPNMSVNVAVGDAFVPGTENNEQGVYLVENRTAVLNVAIGAAHATLARYDIVYARVEDQAYSGAANQATIAVVAGTPAGSPAEPTIPANSIQLARVTVGAAVTSIVTGNILDRRGFTTKGMATALGGIIVTTSGNIPTANLHEGLFRYDTDVDRFYYYNGSAWVGAAAAAAPAPQFLVANIANGTATTYTEFEVNNSILVAPYPLTMIVRVRGTAGFSGGTPSIRLWVRDEAGNDITQGPSLAIVTDGVLFHLPASAGTVPFTLLGKKDYAASATCGFRLSYLLSGSNVHLDAVAEVEFVPKVA